MLQAAASTVAAIPARGVNDGVAAAPAGTYIGARNADSNVSIIGAAARMRPGLALSVADQVGVHVEVPLLREVRGDAHHGAVERSRGQPRRVWLASWRGHGPVAGRIFDLNVP